MSNVKRRTKTLTTGGWQAYTGAGVLRYAAMDGTSLSGNVLSLYDGSAVTDPLAATWTIDTDFGLTAPDGVFRKGSIVATMGTTSANTHRGVPFARGLFVNKTGDTTHTALLDLIITPLINKSVNIGGKALTTDSVKLFDGPGILHGVRITVDAAEVSLGTVDFTFADSGAADRTIWTGTNYVTAGPALIAASTTTSIDDAGTERTTAATGTYPNEGIAFLDGLKISLAQANAGAGVRSCQVECLIEA